MRLSRLLLSISVVLALAACSRAPSRQAYAPVVPVAQVPASSDLDAMMYGSPPQAYRPSYPQRRVAQVVPIQEVMPDDREPYLLDTGDKLRVVVFGQDVLSNTYAVDASGAISIPLVGRIEARDLTTAQLASAIAGHLKQSYIRDPSVAVEVETYRPFFVLGEVTYPGQYPFVPHMTAEKAVAIAGGFTPRAKKDKVTITRKLRGMPAKYALPMQGVIRPGDTITVGERWF